jgi:type I restriction enzyme S subunit
MAGEWREVTVGELAPFAYGKGLTEGQRNSTGRVPVYGSNGVVGFHDASLTNGPTVVIGRKGTVGAVHYTAVPCWPIDTTFYVTGTDPLLVRYRYYLLKSLGLEHMNADSAVPGLNRDAAHARQIRVPSTETEQRAIAHILGTLDDKIELNRRRNQTLEAMARALFKDWFVDFQPVRAKQSARTQTGGPVRAKMEGREPYLPADLWQLFPDRLDDEGKPEGWEMACVGDIGNVICGKTPSTRKPEYYGDDVPFITIPDMHGKVFSVATQKRLSYAGAASQQNKMLPPGAICVSCIATLGLVVITTEPSQTNQQINSVIPARGDETYFWYWTLKNLGEEIKAGGSGGSVLGNLSTGRFSKLQVNASTRSLRLAYNARVENLFSQILATEFESQTLAQLRDTLLPKLISGELRVKDAEKFLETVL